jgi:tight adherence protein B
MDLLAAVAIFFLVMIGAAAVIVRRHGRPGLSREMMRRMSPSQSRGTDDIMRADGRSGGGLELFAALRRIDLLQRLEASMWQAGIYAPVADVLLVEVILFGAGVAVAGAFWGDALLSLGFGGAMASLPMLYIKIRRQRRLRAFTVQLPYALDLIKSSLEAGHSLLRGFQVVVAEFADPIGSEFRSVIEQSRLGLPLPRALEEMLKRVPVEDLRMLVVAVRVQSEVGSSLAQIISRLCEIVRTRQRLQQQIRALTAQSRLSGMIVGLLPVVMLAAFSVIQPQYTHTLFHDPTGIKILKVAIVLDALAFITIRKLLKVKY